MYGEDGSAGKALASKPDILSSVLRTYLMKERTNSHKLSSHFHTLAVIHRYIHRHMQTHTHIHLYKHIHAYILNHAKTLKNKYTYIHIYKYKHPPMLSI